MFIRLFAVTVLLPLLTTTLPAKATPPGGTCADLLPSVVGAVGARGGACALIRDGAVVEEAAFGTDGNDHPMTIRTPASLGSVSKPMLATAIVNLAGRGEIDLSAPVVEALPALAVIPGSGAITARQLLNHTSGLPIGGRYLDMLAERTPAQLVADLDDVRLEAEPGTRTHYSSLGYAVLSAWMEASTGRTISELLTSELALPDLVTTPAAAMSIPPGSRGALLPPMPVVFDGAGLGYGYTGGSVHTLAAFAEASLADRERLALMTGVDPGQTGLGWRVDEWPADQSQRTRRVWHTGMVPGYFTAVHLLPEEGTAAVLVLNRSGHLDQQRLYDASVSMLAVVRGQTPDPIGPPLARLISGTGIAVTTAVAALLIASHRRLLSRLGGGLALALAVTPAVLVTSQSMPLRALSLWIPDLALAALAGSLLAVIVGAALRSRLNRAVAPARPARTRRRDGSPPAPPRPGR